MTFLKSILLSSMLFKFSLSVPVVISNSSLPEAGLRISLREADRVMYHAFDRTIFASSVHDHEQGAMTNSVKLDTRGTLIPRAGKDIFIRTEGNDLPDRTFRMGRGTITPEGTRYYKSPSDGYYIRCADTVESNGEVQQEWRIVQSVQEAESSLTPFSAALGEIQNDPMRRQCLVVWYSKDLVTITERWSNREYRSFARCESDRHNIASWLIKTQELLASKRLIHKDPLPNILVANLPHTITASSSLLIDFQKVRPITAEDLGLDVIDFETQQGREKILKNVGEKTFALLYSPRMKTLFDKYCTPRKLKKSTNSKGLSKGRVKKSQPGKSTGAGKPNRTGNL